MSGRGRCGSKERGVEMIEVGGGLLEEDLLLCYELPVGLRATFSEKTAGPFCAALI